MEFQNHFDNCIERYFELMELWEKLPISKEKRAAYKAMVEQGRYNKQVDKVITGINKVK